MIKPIARLQPDGLGLPIAVKAALETAWLYLDPTEKGPLAFDGHLHCLLIGRARSFMGVRCDQGDLALLSAILGGRHHAFPVRQDLVPRVGGCLGDLERILRSCGVGKFEWWQLAAGVLVPVIEDAATALGFRALAPATSVLPPDVFGGAIELSLRLRQP